jgi:hypothetical protein
MPATEDLFNPTHAADYKSHRVIMDRRTAAVTYLHAWFVPDCISSFPYAWLVHGRLEYLNLLKVCGPSVFLSCLSLMMFVSQQHCILKGQTKLAVLYK